MRPFVYRQYVRAKVNIPVTILAEEGDIFCQTVNLSVDGMLLEAERPLPPQTRLMVRFPLERQEAFVVAEVLRTEGLRYGCRFTELTEMARRMLTKLVLDNIRPQPAVVSPF